MAFSPLLGFKSFACGNGVDVMIDASYCASCSLYVQDAAGKQVIIKIQTLYFKKKN